MEQDRLSLGDAGDEGRDRVVWPQPPPPQDAVGYAASAANPTAS